MDAAPKNIQIIGHELAILWSDDRESYFSHEYLRQHSPSAENMGERDILGNQHGGHGPRTFPDIKILGWDFVGNYGLRLIFSDGHQSGIYSWSYLQELCEHSRKQS